MVWVIVGTSRCVMILSYPDISSTGVITNEGVHTHGGDAWKDLVVSAWHQLRNSKNIGDLEMQFITVRSRTEFTMDMLIEGEQGTLRGANYPLFLLKTCQGHQICQW